MEPLSYLPQIYCDLDGVLVEFANPVLERINQCLSGVTKVSERTQKTIDKIKAQGIQSVDISHIIPGPAGQIETRNKGVTSLMFYVIKEDVDFWSHLQFANGGQELWNYLSKLYTIILSAPTDEASIQGKNNWVKKNLKPYPAGVITEKEKYKYALDELKRPCILIDDFEKNIGPWRDAGGIGILHKTGDTATTIGQLEKLLSNIEKEKL